MQRLLSVEQAQREWTTGVTLLFDMAVHQPDQVDAVARVLERNRGACPVFLFIRDPAGKVLRLRASEEYRVNPTRFPVHELEAVLGRGHVQFSRQGNGNGRK